MTEISSELVPRSLASLHAELRTVAERFPAVHTVNVPDLLRFPLRSWDACAHARYVVPTAIPHLLAMDFAPDAPFVLREELAAAGINTVLVVTGDPPQDLAHRVHAPTLAWSRDFAAHALDWARAAWTHLYFMPIRVDLATWLGDIL